MNESFFGNNLKYYRKKAGLTQNKLANLIGVGQVTIANYERGARFPKEATLTALARSVNTSLDSLLTEGGKLITPIPGDPFQEKQSFSLESMIEILLKKTSTGDWVYLKRWIDANFLSLDEVYSGILIPLLYNTGRLWLEGKVSIAQEHLISGKIRELIILTSDYLKKDKNEVPADAPRWMGVCAPGEQHDLALLMNAQLMKHQGWDALFLGTNVPISDLVDTIDRYFPRILGISITMSTLMKDLETYLEILEEQKPSGLFIILGGPGVDIKNISRFPAVTHVVKNLEESKIIARDLYCQYNNA